MNAKKTLNLLAVLVLLMGMLLSACGGKPEAQTGGALKGNITISGAFALYPMMQVWADEFKKVNPDVNFDISAGGAGKGMADTLAGAVDIGMVSRDVTAEEETNGAYWVAVVKDAVFPMVNANNPVLADLVAKGVTKEQFIAIYITGEIKTWGQLVGKPEITDEIHVYTRSDAAGAPEVWAKYLGKKQENLLGVGVSGDPALLEAVIKDPLGIGYNNLGYAFDNSTGMAVAGSAVVPVDIDGNGQADAVEVLESKAEAVEVVANGTYPSPPARPLNLVTKGKPSDVVQAFILWVLTDGQKFVSQAGYVALPQASLDEALGKVR